MCLINNNQPQINPHMKFTAPPKGVVQPPAVYSYSLAEELRLGENEYRQMLKTMNKSRLALIAEKHPNLKSNIMGVVTYTLGLITLCCGWRYRHSIPLLKSVCKKPKKRPPNFLVDVRRIWRNFIGK